MEKMTRREFGKTGVKMLATLLAMPPIIAEGKRIIGAIMQMAPPKFMAWIRNEDVKKTLLAFHEAFISEKTEWKRNGKISSESAQALKGAHAHFSAITHDEVSISEIDSTIRLETKQHSGIAGDAKEYFIEINTMLKGVEISGVGPLFGLDERKIENSREYALKCDFGSIMASGELVKNLHQIQVKSAVSVQAL